MTMPSSPRTPTRRENRRVSIDSFTSSNGYSDFCKPKRPSHSRKSSLYSPTTPRPQSSHSMNGFSAVPGDFDGTGEGRNDLGSLADELAEAWDEDEEGDAEGMEVERDQRDVELADTGRAETPTVIHGESDVVSSPQGVPIAQGGSSPSKLTEQAQARQRQRAYDGSEYGSNSDFEEAPSIPPALEARMASIDALARQGTEDNGGPTDGVIKRVVEGLRDLGAQSGMENATTRLITGHTALSTHVTHQTRMLQTLAYPLLSPLSAPPDPETIDEILPILIETSTALPQPTTPALSSLLHLSTYTNDLITTLSTLSDTLHMSRQTMTLATRRLRSAKELVAEMRTEIDVRDEGIRWIEKGDWQSRLERRECGHVCRDVVGGFEEVCNGWRERLFAGAEVGAA